jgi:hypothetical protein
VVKANFDAAAALTAMFALVTVPVPPADSVATNVQVPAASMVTALKATSPLPLTVPEVVPVSVQLEVMVIVAPVVAPVTVKDGRTVPAVAVVGGAGE